MEYWIIGIVCFVIVATLVAMKMRVSIMSILDRILGRNRKDVRVDAFAGDPEQKYVYHRQSLAPQVGVKTRSPFLRQYNS